MSFYTLATYLVLASAAVVLLILLTIDAPYGKRDREGWGPAISIRWSWLLLEVPSFIVPLCILLAADTTPGWPGLVLIAIWLGHYFHRSFIYPFFSLRPRPGASFKVLMLLLGAPMNALIGAMMALMVLSEPQLQDNSWLLSAPFIIGMVLCVSGLAMAKWADAVLLGLRKPGDSAYYIPRGGAYRYISCPNYLGEILQWLGFALAAYNLAGLAFALYSIANLLPRALASHKWYREQFAEYPVERRAVIPFVL
jgi:3-oxo-5-alpha-steroid 4-dehydrogenase 1